MLFPRVLKLSAFGMLWRHFPIRNIIQRESVYVRKPLLGILQMQNAVFQIDTYR